MEQRIINKAKSAVDDLINLSIAGSEKLWIDYDKEVDVLYISFGKPQKADNSIQTDDGIIRRVKNKKLIGLTIINASRFA